MSLLHSKSHSPNCSAMTLVAKSSRKRVREGLNDVGEEVVKLTLVWACLKEVKDANGINLDSPKAEELEAIAQRYNQLREQLPLPADRNPTVNSKTIETWIKLIGEALLNS